MQQNGVGGVDGFGRGLLGTSVLVVHCPKAYFGFGPLFKSRGRFQVTANAMGGIDRVPSTNGIADELGPFVNDLKNGERKDLSNDQGGGEDGGEELKGVGQGSGEE